MRDLGTGVFLPPAQTRVRSRSPGCLNKTQTNARYWDPEQGHLDHEIESSTARAPTGTLWGAPPKPPLGSISVDRVMAALMESKEVALADQLKELTHNNTGVLEHFWGCGRVLIQEACILFGEIRCICK